LALGTVWQLFTLEVGGADFLLFDSAESHVPIFISDADHSWATIKFCAESDRRLAYVAATDGGTADGLDLAGLVQVALAVNIHLTLGLVGHHGSRKVNGALVDSSRWAHWYRAPCQCSCTQGTQNNESYHNPVHLC